MGGAKKMEQQLGEYGDEMSEPLTRVGAVIQVPAGAGAWSTKQTWRQRIDEGVPVERKTQTAGHRICRACIGPNCSFKALASQFCCSFNLKYFRPSWKPWMVYSCDYFRERGVD